jgi:hypothetical protein
MTERQELAAAQPMAFALVLIAGLASAPAGAAAVADCTVEWALTGRGVPIGNARDRLHIGSDQEITVSSAFTPSGLLSLFGVEAVTRQFVIDAHGDAVSRSEFRGGSRPEANVWRRSSGGQWERTLNGVQDKRQSVLPGPVIDSTSFPYLLQLGLVERTARQWQVGVISKGKAYQAALSLEVVESGSLPYRLGFKSSDGSGSAWLDQDFHPVRFEFLDEHGSLRGERTSGSCN